MELFFTVVVCWCAGSFVLAIALGKMLAGGQQDVCPSLWTSLEA